MTDLSLATANTFTFGNSYFDAAFDDFDTLINNAETNLRGLKINFDSMVGIGLSGHLVLPVLARHFNVPFLALRKQGVDCHDNYGIGQYGRGTIGKRWILIDDFICSGQTMKTANNRVEAALKLKGAGFTTEFVGTYCYDGYGNKTGAFYYPNRSKASLARIDIDGDFIEVDGEAYSNLLATIADCIRNKVVDPKGKAIAYYRKCLEREYRGYPEISLDELSAMAVFAVKQIGTQAEIY